MIKMILLTKDQSNTDLVRKQYIRYKYNIRLTTTILSFVTVIQYNYSVYRYNKKIERCLY